MKQKKSGGKRGGAIVILGLFLFLSAMESIDIPAINRKIALMRLRWYMLTHSGMKGSNPQPFLMVLAVVGLILLAVAIIAVVVLASRRRQESEFHTHDRIDHSSDLVIDKTTGKTVSSGRKSSAPHSTQAHWKQQMDQLLANGTIDRDEYRVMMNRKF